MKISLTQQTHLFADTGGKPFNPKQPSLIMIHGVLCDHSVWITQSRYFAHHGWNVFAIDLPGHGKSNGAAPLSIEQAAESIIALVEKLKLKKFSLAGHSLGSLIALETAAQLKDKVNHLILLGTAAPMTVSPVLLKLSQENVEEAIHQINIFSHSKQSQKPSTSTCEPSCTPYDLGVALNQRIFRSNPNENLLYIGFEACNTYSKAIHAMGLVTAQTLILAGEFDRMTPPRKVEPLRLTAEKAGIDLCIQTIPAGHNMMIEAPEQTINAMNDFLSKAPKS